VALEEGFLTLGGERAVHRLAGERQPQREQEDLGLDPAQHHPQVGEVDLGFGAGQVRLRYERLTQLSPGLGEDLRAPFGDVVTHRRIGQPDHVMLVDQPSQHPPSRVTLLLRRVQIRPQHVVDRGLERRQPLRGPRRCLARRRDRARQCLPHRSPMHVMLRSQLADRQTVDPRVASDRREQLHTRPHPSAPFVITSPSVITLRWGQFKPS
jgi:hypothetical protein